MSLLCILITLSWSLQRRQQISCRGGAEFTCRGDRKVTSHGEGEAAAAAARGESSPLYGALAASRDGLENERDIDCGKTTGDAG